MRRQESYRSISKEKVVGGVLVGAILGAATAFLCSNSGKRIRQNLASMCSELSEQAQDLAQQVARKSEDVTHDVSDYLFNGHSCDKSHLNLLIGSVAGAILGVSASLYFSHKPHQPDLRHRILHNVHRLTKKSHQLAGDIEHGAHDVAENFEDRVSSWVHVAQKFIDNINGCAEDVCTKKHSRYHEEEDSTLDKVVDWTAFGLRLYKALKK